MSIEANDSAAQRAATMRGDAPEAGEETRVSDWLGALRGMIRRRYPVMILVALATAAIAITIVLLMTPKYESVARLRIDPMRNPMATAQEANVGLTSEAIDTEVSALGSPELAREVVKRLNLQNDPEFAVGVNRQIAAGELAPEERLGAVAESVAKHLSVRRDKLTYVLAVSFTSREAVKSARIANAFAEAFVQTRVGSRASTAQDQVTFLTQQIEKLGAESQAADARVGQYRAQAGIVEGGASGTITDQQIAPLSTQLAEAASAAAEAQAKVTQARRQIASGNLDAVGDVRASPVIADLRRQRAEVTRNMGEIASRYGDRHPETIKVRQQLQGLDAQIKDEAERAVSSLDAEAAAANARVGSLRGGVNVLKSQQAVNTRAAVVADGLERDAATKRAALDRLNQLRIEALQSTRNIIGNIDIVDRAQIPLAPAAPRKSLLAGLALAASLALGFGVITVQ
ncbi:MAG: chain-length determining protein, partial [Sphingomonadales bacterium]